ncbi:hypothetical protein [Pelomonas aquatica]|jgi:hypothetical protein|uniref:Transporter n=1 Tax=Pelomonas aquatica TaxID=431058 RepID=A0A9X4R6B3_9BURK|nr:hypothetical protein [Pelomonas aquatica]MCY4757130.1 hypothetical protein [Pelomonas aquatica]MDG0864566.1 hypothetical protein [Pelomonas aquatica]
MNARDLVSVIATLSLIFTGIYFGIRFLKLKNQLLGWEWIVLGFSASNILLGILLQNASFTAVGFFCDAFSRGVGFPVIATLGFVELFKGRKFSWQFDVAAFAGGAAFALAARTVWLESPTLQQFYLVAGLPFNVCMLYFAARLFAVRLVGHGIAILAGLAALWGISLLEGGYIAFPGEETNVLFNWLTIAEFVWAVVFAQYFFAYRAYEAATNGRGISGEAVYRHKGRAASA